MAAAATTAIQHLLDAQTVTRVASANRRKPAVARWLDRLRNIGRYQPDLTASETGSKNRTTFRIAAADDRDSVVGTNIDDRSGDPGTSWRRRFPVAPEMCPKYGNRQTEKEARKPSRYRTGTKDVSTVSCDTISLALASPVCLAVSLSFVFGGRTQEHNYCFRQAP